MTPQQPAFNSHQIKQLFFIAVLIGLFILLFNNLKEFLPGFLGAITIYILTHKWYRYLTITKKWHNGLTAALFIIASFLVLVLPIAALVNMLTGKAGEAISSKKELIAGINAIAEKVKLWTGFDIMQTNTLEKFTAKGGEWVTQFFGATFNVLGVLGVMFFVYYFLLTSGRDFEKLAMQYLPLKRDNLKLIRKEVNIMVVSNAIGIPLIAILQSIIAVIGYFIFGVNQPMFWFVITCFTAMIPVVGSTIVWFPLAVFLLINGQQWQGIGLIIWGIVAVGAADNIFRIMLSKKIGDTHPLITIFGVVVGVKLFGFIGLVFGPLLITLFLLLLKIYKNEFLVTK
jgi:predicted PurR-regulated permease PerM